MIHVRRHTRTVRGRASTVRAHERDGAPAARQASGTATVWDDGTPPPEDAYWDYDEGRWVTEPGPQPELGHGEGMSPAFAALVAQDPSLDNENYRKLRALRESGYTGPVDQDGNAAQYDFMGMKFDAEPMSASRWRALDPAERDAALAELRDARDELERISARDRCESGAYLDANDRVIRAEHGVPFWRRG